MFENSIYSMEWSDLSPKGRKTILFISLRASKNIVISVGSLFILSLDSFVKVHYEILTIYAI